RSPRISLAREPAGALISMSDTFTAVHRDLIIALAANYCLPAVFPARFNVADGGLISYGVDSIDMHRRAASYVHHILKGEKPDDMPVQLPIHQCQNGEGAGPHNSAAAARPRRRGHRMSPKAAPR